MSAISRSYRVITKQQLVKLRINAIRSGKWFKVLQKIDRSLIDLAIKVIDVINSSKLADSIQLITTKLENVLNSRLLYRIRKVGFPIAHKISAIACSLGNIGAKKWAYDISFANYLAVMNLSASEYCDTCRYSCKLT